VFFMDILSFKQWEGSWKGIDETLEVFTLDVLTRTRYAAYVECQGVLICCHD